MFSSSEAFAYVHDQYSNHSLAFTDGVTYPRFRHALHYVTTSTMANATADESIDYDLQFDRLRITVLSRRIVWNISAGTGTFG